MVDGTLAIRIAFGLGVDRDEDVARAHPYADSGVLQLYEEGWEHRQRSS